MPMYAYQAVDEKGKSRKGTLSADSAKNARKKLRAQELIPIEIDELEQPSTQKKASTTSLDRKIPVLHLSLFTQELAALLEAGLEVEESINSIAQSLESPKFKNIVLSVHAKIIEGYSLSQALNEFPKAFPKLYRATIEAGEKAGYLASILSHLSEYLQAQQRINQKVQQAMIYPMILTIVSIGIIIFLLTYVTPKIINIFEDSAQTLPMATQILIVISDFIKQYFWWLVVGAIGALVLWVFLMRLTSFRRGVHVFLLKLPLFGRLLNQIQLSRFLKALGIMLKARVSILEALTASANLVSAIPISDTLVIARQQIKEGVSVYHAMKATHYFSPICLQFIASGEKTGNLDEMLLHASIHQEHLIQRTIDMLLTLFEPILILLMGGVVLFIVLATLLPMFQMSNLIV